MGCHFLLQGIFPTQGSNLGLKKSKVFLKTCLQLTKRKSTHLAQAPEASKGEAALMEVDVLRGMEQEGTLGQSLENSVKPA